MITTKENPIVDTQNIMKKEYKHTPTKGHQMIKSKIRNKEQCIYKTENNEQNGNNRSLPINNYF